MNLLSTLPRRFQRTTHYFDEEDCSVIHSLPAFAAEYKNATGVVHTQRTVWVHPASPTPMQTPRRIRTNNISRVLLADDQAIFRAGVARVLASQEDITVLSQCDSADLTVEMVAASRSCVLILAESLKTDMDRMLAAAHATSTRVILMTESGKKPAAAILRRIDGLLTRQTTADDLLACIRSVSKGERVLQAQSGENQDSFGDRIRALLSTRELQIIGFVVQGRKNRQIAGAIGTTEQVVKNYLRSIYDKTGSSDRLELALFTLHHRTLAEAAADAAQALAPSTV